MPVTHWGQESLYSVDACSDAFTAYFEPLSGVTAEDLVGVQCRDFFPAKWTNANLLTGNEPRWCCDDPAELGDLYLKRSEKIVVVDYYIGVIDVMRCVPVDHELAGQSVAALYRFLATKYLRPRNHIKSAVDSFYQRNIAGVPTIAVHVRGLDKKFEEPELDAINARYFDLLDRDGCPRILLLTDDEIWVGAFRARYGDRIVITDSQRTTGDVGIHSSKAPSIDRAKLGNEVMRDTYLALRCDKFLGNGRSNLSAMVEVLKAWEDGACRLLIPSQLLNEPNLAVSVGRRQPALPEQERIFDRSYQLGEEIDFSDPYASRRFMRKGWPLSESWGVWTDGDVAALPLRSRKNDEPLILRAYVRPFLVDGHDELCVRVACNGCQMAKWIFKRTERPKQCWRLARIAPRPPSVIAPELHISFDLHTPRSPISLGLSEDTRRLGLSFFRLSLNRADEVGGGL